MLSTFPVILEAFATGPGSQNLIAISTNLQSLRILRTLKLIVWFSSLKIIVLCIIQAFKSMAFIMILVFITAFVYSVIGVNMFYTYTKSDKPGLIYQFYFTDVGSGLQGLFQLLTMDRWDDMNRDFAQVADPFWSYTFVISWVFLGAFIFRNIFIGVMGKKKTYIKYTDSAVTLILIYSPILKKKSHKL